MRVKDVFRVFRKNWYLVLGFPTLMGLFVFFLTRNTPKIYSSDILIYTGVASGYKLTGEENPRIDFFAYNNTLDNLMVTLSSTETLEETGLRLLAKHLIAPEPNPKIISNQQFEHLQKLFPDTLRKKIVVPVSEESTFQNLKEMANASPSNLVSTIVNSEQEVYGISYIREHMNAQRQEESDMLEVAYQSSDPAVTKLTLLYLSEVFLKNYNQLKEGQINKVVDYFTMKTLTDHQRLRKAENELKNFMVKHKIVNYEEQSTQLAQSRKELQDMIAKEKMELAAAEAAMRKLGQKLHGRQDMIRNNALILEKREQLSRINNKIANANLKKTSGQQLLALKSEASELEKEIREIVKNIYFSSMTEEGISSEALLEEYLNNLLVSDESIARLAMMKDLERDYEGEYARFAPLAPVIAALEREVKFAEEEYKKSLDALNTNRQKQQNLKLKNNVRLVGQPRFPVKPEADTTMLLVGGALFAGLILISAILIGMEWFDEKLKSPARAEKVTGLELVGAFPMVPSNSKKIDYPYLENLLTAQCLGSVLTRTKSENKPVKFIITGTRPGEGKIRTAARLACKLATVNGKVLLLYPNTEKIEMESFLNSCQNGKTYLRTQEYRVSESFIELRKFEELTGNLTDFNYVILVIPALSESQIPGFLVKETECSFIVANAERVWDESDTFLLNLFKKSGQCAPMLILNKVSEEEIREICGELPRVSRKYAEPVKFKKKVWLSKVS